MDECGAAGSTLNDVMRRAPFLPAFTKAYHDKLLPRPLFAKESDVSRVSADLSGFFDLLISLPRRLFDGDLGRFCAALGMDEQRAELAAMSAGTPPPMHGRADLIHDGTSFKLLEFNVGSELGGTEFGELGRRLLEVDEFRSFADRNRLSYVDTPDEIIETFRTLAAPITGGREPTIAIIEWDGALAAYGELFDSFRSTMAARGHTVLLGEVSQVVNRDGKLYLDGEPIDVALRYFVLETVARQPHGRELIEPIYQAHEAGGTLLYTTMQTWPYAYKDPLAMLSDTRNRAAFSAEESALIDRLLPWTRLLVDGPTEVHGETVDLTGYVLANRENLIIKPHAGLGGENTTAGWGVDDDEWRATVGKAMGAGFIVQHKVTAELEPVLNPDTGEVEDWWPIHGMYLTPRGYAGTWVRAQRPEQGAVVAYNFKPLLTTLFTVPDDLA